MKLILVLKFSHSLLAFPFVSNTICSIPSLFAPPLHSSCASKKPSSSVPNDGANGCRQVYLTQACVCKFDPSFVAPSESSAPPPPSPSPSMTPGVQWRDDLGPLPPIPAGWDLAKLIQRKRPDVSIHLLTAHPLFIPPSPFPLVLPLSGDAPTSRPHEAYRRGDGIGRNG